MYLLYIDDSGTNDLKKENSVSPDGGNSLYFVLGSILLKAKVLEEVEKKFQEIKNHFFKDPTDEIKLSVRQKIFKEHGVREIYREEVLNTLSSIDCKLFAVGQNKFRTYTNGLVSSKHDIYKLSFQHIIYLINSYMYTHKIKEPIIVFIDTKDSNHDRLIYDAYKDALDNNKLFRNFDSSIFSPSINVVISRHTLGAQLADFVAGSIWRSLEAKENKYANIIKTNFHCSDSGNPIGYGYINCEKWLK